MKANSAALDQAGIAVPLALLDREGNASHLAKALAASPLKGDAEGRDRLERFTTFVGGARGKTIFVSAEAFETAICEGGISMVADRLDGMGLRKRAAVLIIRNQIDALNSEHGQRRKRMMVVKPKDEALEVVFSRGRKNWWLQWQSLQDHGFDARLGVYRGRDTEMPIARQVMTLAGLAECLGDTADFDAKTANESIGELGCFAAQHLSGILDKRGKSIGTSERRWVSNLLIGACREFPDQPYNGFTAENRARITAHFEDSNQRLAEHLRGGDEELQRLLRSRADDRDKSPEIWRDLTPAQRQTVTAMLELVSDQLDLTRKRHNILPREEILGSLPSVKGVRDPSRKMRRIKPDDSAGSDRLDRPDPVDPADRPARPAKPVRPPPQPQPRPNGTGRKPPRPVWVKDPLRKRLTFARIKASLIRRLRGLLAKR